MRRWVPRSAIILPIGLTVFQFGLVNIWAFIGALRRRLLVFRLGGAGGPGGMTRLLLTGYAVGSILAALLTMAMYVSGANLRAIFSFLLGGLAAASWSGSLIAAPIILTTCLLVGLRARTLDGLLLGDSAASHLGVDVKRERGHPPGPRLDGHGRGGRHHRADRVRRARRAARRAPAGRAAGAAGRAAVGDLRGASCWSSPISWRDCWATSRSGVVMAILGAPFFLVLLRQTRSGYEL